MVKCYTKHIIKNQKLELLIIKMTKILFIPITKLFVIGLLYLLVGNVSLFGATKTASVTGNWSSTTTWGGQAVPTSADAVVINDNVNVTVDIAASCLSLTINDGGNVTSVLISGTNSLTITNAISIGAGTGKNDNKFIAVDAGTMSCSSVTMSNPSNQNRDSYIRISSGTATVSGNITMNGAKNRNQIVFTDAGTLNIGGTISGGTISNTAGSAATLTRGTVNFNGSVAQTIPNNSYNFYNVTVSNTNAGGAVLEQMLPQQIL